MFRRGIIITTITTTVTTTIEKITSVIHPVAGPAYHNVCKPVCWALTYPCYWLWTALVWTLSSIYSTYTGQDASTSATTTTTTSYRKQQYTSKYSNKERWRWGGIGCCLCLPCLLALLLLSLLSFLPAWLDFLAGSISTSEQIIPLVIPAVVNQQILKEMGSIREAIRLEYGNHEDRLASFEAELANLKASVIKLDEQYFLLAENLNRGQDFSQISSSVHQILTQFIKEMIDVALWKFAADKTGLVDYALESGGGYVITVRCSEPYNKLSAVVSVWGIPLYYPTNSPRVAISPEMSPGDCWPFKGKKGYLAVKLSRTVVPSSFSIEHIPKAIAPANNIDSAPSDFTVLCLSGEEDILGVSLGNYTFQEDGSPLQYFPVQIRDPAPCRFVELRILDNHGNKEYTCLYRFRVHGTPAELMKK